MSFTALARPFLQLRVLASGIVAKEPFALIKGAMAFIRRALSALFSRLDSSGNSHAVNHGTQEGSPDTPHAADTRSNEARTTP
jgi:hypothetical protein